MVREILSNAMIGTTRYEEWTAAYAARPVPDLIDMLQDDLARLTSDADHGKPVDYNAALMRAMLFCDYLRDRTRTQPEPKRRRVIGEGI